MARGRGPLLGFCLLGFAACADEVSTRPESRAPSGPEGAQQLAVPSNWIGYELGLKPASVHDARPLGAPGMDSSADSSAPVADLGDRGPAHLVVADKKLGIQYRVDIEEDALMAIDAAMAERARDAFGEEAAATGDSEPSAPALVQKAIAGDNRVRFGIADGYPADAWPFRTIGHTDQCTASFLSETLAITAAHCILNKDNNVIWGSFRPREDGSVVNPNPYLNPDHPYGSWEYDRVAYAIGFKTQNCINTKKGTPEIEKCYGQDWAFLNVQRPAPSMPFPGAMCYGWAGLDILRKHNLYMRGYPSCGAASSPPNCTPYTLYGDPDACVIGTSWDADADGWHRAIDHNCNHSSGDSGSPLYAVSPSWLPGCSRAIIAINSGSHLVGGVYKMTSRRITPWLGGQISYFLSAWQ